MRKLIRPEPPKGFFVFAAKGQAEISDFMATNPGEGASSYLSRTLFFRQRQTLSDIKRIMSVASEGTCHACESHVEALGNSDIEMFRPKLQAGNARKDRSHPHHYWWLLYEWDNLQLLCPVCNRYKGSLFPVTGTRALPQARGVELHAEGALLLNPFDDDPADHMTTNKDGLLVPFSAQGQTTIEVYQLNREELVARRKSLRKRLRTIVADLSLRQAPDGTHKQRAIESVLKLVGVEYRGSVLQMLDDLIRVSSSPPRQAPSAPWSATPAAIPKKFEARWIRTIQLSDFGPIRNLTLTFPDPTGGREPWLGIVGENGVGKSTFLKAIALTLVGEGRARELCPDASLLHNRTSRKRSGFVEVQLSDGLRRRLVFGPKSRELVFEGPEINIPVIAFGANRITDRRGSARNLPTADAVDNLFDPVLPLTDTEAWLADPSRVNSRNFASFAENLKFLLDLPIETAVSRRGGHIYFEGRGGRQSLATLSDGFRSIIGLVGHIMKYLAYDTPVMSEAEGTVLLDELELHLHPRWKIMIVEKLRELFPRVRFVITTHDPLCLRGLNPAESFALREHPGRHEVEVLPLVLRPGMTVDELLTGGWFNLGTTYDRETEEMIYDLSALSLKQDTLRVTQKAELPAEEEEALTLLHKELQGRLSGIGGAASELKSLADVARGAVDVEANADIDRNALRDKLKAAFSNEGGTL